MNIGTLSNANFQKSYLWRVSGLVGGEDVYAKSASPPGFGGQPIEVQVRGAVAHDVGVYKPTPMDITFYDSVGGSVSAALLGWAKEQYDPQKGCGTRSTKNITLSLEGCGGGGGGSFTLKNAFITDFKPGQLTSDNQSLYEVSCTIMCDDVSM